MNNYFRREADPPAVKIFDDALKEQDDTDSNAVKCKSDLLPTGSCMVIESPLNGQI
jgi:hypothetical protein